MFKKDNVWLGLALGLVVPGIAFLLVQVLKRNLIVLAKDDLLYVGCVALNLVLIKFVYKDEYEQTVRGIISASFICAMVFFFYKYNL